MTPKQKQGTEHMPISTISSEAWWEARALEDRQRLAGGAVATQTQCSSGGGGNGKCNSSRIRRNDSAQPQK
jgi:hypothetical protein